MRAAVCTGYGPPEVLQIRTVPAFFLSRLKVRKGQRLLVYGASGAIGTAAVQLARHLDLGLKKGKVIVTISPS